MGHQIVNPKNADTFADYASFLDGASAGAGIRVLMQGAPFAADEGCVAILVELGDAYLGEFTGESLGDEGWNVVGFSRYRNGRDAPSRLVELVVQKRTRPEAIAAARQLFQDIGLETVVCDDQPGRIIDRLVRPKYNAALRFLDEGLATQSDMDLTCRLGLGYPDGPIERVVRGGLDLHERVSRRLFEATGQAGFVPARRAVVAARRTAAAGNSAGRPLSFEIDDNQ